MKKLFASLFLLTFILALCCPTGAVSINEKFSYSFGNGSNPTADGHWMYEWFAEETDTFDQMRWAAEGYFEAPFSSATASDTHWYCRIRSSGNNMHPGAQADSVKTFICPESGTVEFNIIATRQNAVASGHTGNSARIFVNEKKVWPEDSDYLELNDTTAQTIKTQLTVQKGDKIRFMIGSLGDSSADGVNVANHSVTYLSGQNLTPEKKSYTIACVGDSITEGYSLSGGLKGDTAFPHQLQLLLNETGIADFHCENYGKSATTALTTGDRPYQNTIEYTSSINSNPNLVLIGFGANDSKPANWNAQNFKRDYIQLIQKYMKLPSKPKVYLLYTTYVADQSKTSISRDTIQNQTLKIELEIAEQLGLKVIDLNTFTRKNTSSYNDGVHPNDALAKKMAEYIYNALCNDKALGLKAANATDKTVLCLNPSEPEKPTTEQKPTTSTETVQTPSETETTDVTTTTVATDTQSASTTQKMPEISKGPSPLPWILGIVGIAVIAAVLTIVLLTKKKR